MPIDNLKPVRVATSIPAPLVPALQRRMDQANCKSQSELLAAILIDDLLERPDHSSAIALLRESHKVRTQFAVELAKEIESPTFDPLNAGPEWLKSRVRSLVETALSDACARCERPRVECVAA